MAFFLYDPSKIVFCKRYVFFRDGHHSTMIFLWFPCYEHGVCIYPRWTVLKIHLPPKVVICILACVMMNHIFILYSWSIIFHLNLSKMKARSCKIWFGQSFCHPHRLSICLASKPQSEHITIMTIHCNQKDGGEQSLAGPT